MEKILKLYEFQNLDMELHNYEAALKKSENRQKLIKARNILLEGQKTAENYEKAIEDLKKGIEVKVNTYNEFKSQLDEIVKKDEALDKTDLQAIAAVKKEAETHNYKLRDMQNDIINSLKKINDNEKSYYNLMVILKKAKDDYIEYKEKHQTEQDESKEKIEAYKKQISEAEKTVDKDLLEKYYEKKKNCFPVVAKVKSEQCGGCFVMLPSLVINNIKQSENIVECENCGRILIVE